MKKKNILIGPLDWGIGHASRCVPVIRELSKYNANIYIGACGRAASFLKNEFPDLDHIALDGYNIFYPDTGSMAMAMLRQSPGILAAIRRENKLLDELVDKYEIDAVISDNRFGLWSAKSYSVYITHQLNIKTGKLKLAEVLLRKIHARYISKFDECWIPDLSDEPGLAGDLSHGSRIDDLHYVGPLSRFAPSDSQQASHTYDIMAIISGPEPQRSIFEREVVGQLEGTDHRSLVVLGKPEEGSKIIRDSGNIRLFSHLGTDKMREAMLSSKLILCRSGYSSIMDLAVLGLQAAFVPTPGQTEQEYLARLHRNNGHYFSVEQKDLNVQEIIKNAKDYSGIKGVSATGMLTKRIAHLMEVI